MRVHPTAPQAPPAAPGAPASHTLDADAVCAALHSTPAGLTAAEAARRLAQTGPNELQASARTGWWTLLAAQFRNVLILILLAATAASAVLGHAVEAAAITVIVLFAVMLGFVQEFRAERALDALRELTAPAASVLRDGRPQEIPARDVVPGDVLLLRAGYRVAADARLLEAVNLQVQEAALTGESLPVEKHTQALPDAALALGERRNLVYAGTTPVAGRGRALVVATGMGTEFGRIARLLQSVDSGRTPLQDNLDRLGTWLARAALVVVALVVAAGLARGQPFIDMLVFGIALAVAVVPEALPAVVTISLALGVQRLIRRHALMRRLAAVETLGSTSIICSDKTGTLTRDQMTVRSLWVDDRLLQVTGAGYQPHGEFRHDGVAIDARADAPLQALLAAGVLACDARLLTAPGGGWTVQGDPTEGALLAAAAKAGIDKSALEARNPRVHEVPFTPESRRMVTVHANATGTCAFAKGAPEAILPTCNTWLRASGSVPLTTADRAHVLQVAQLLGAGAQRVLALAQHPDAAPGRVDDGFTLLGLAGMIDPPRDEARGAIATCAEAGIRVVMITGDHPATAQAVARELGLLHEGGATQVITGAELDTLDAAALARAAPSIAVYARVSPEHKLRVVQALQAQGHVVAMTGDGVNDAPALKCADIGVAMGITGTDVAKEAAAMTLADDNFASIVAAVEEGRGIFGNIKKYLMFLLSSNLGEIGLLAGAAVLGLPLPLSAVQLLYVNLATDGLPALALAVDPPEPDLMRRPPREPRSSIFTPPVLVLMATGGVWSAALNTGLFAWALQSGRGLGAAMTMTFVSLVLTEFLKAYCFRSDRASVLRKPFANKWLNRAMLWELALLMVVIYLPPLHAPFGTMALSATDWGVVLAVALTIVPILEAAKAMVRRGWFGALR